MFPILEVNTNNSAYILYAYNAILLIGDAHIILAMTTVPWQASSGDHGSEFIACDKSGFS